MYLYIFSLKMKKLQQNFKKEFKNCNKKYQILIF
jgi:hypothetical protein